jgi:hypothetical protein
MGARFVEQLNRQAYPCGDWSAFKRPRRCRIRDQQQKGELPGRGGYQDIYVDKNRNISAVRKGTDPNDGEYVGNIRDYPRLRSEAELTRKLEEAPVGYPGFLVMRPPRISLTSATLKRVALAKLSDITLMSAAFGGEDILFQPWLTLLIDYGRGAFLTGVYRTDSSSGDDPESDGLALPIWCLRKSEWLREVDLEQSRGAADLSEYLTGGPQLTHQLVFANRITHPEIDDVMNDVLTVLGSGITVAPAGPRAAEWQFVDLDLADDRLICRIEYSPLIAQSEPLETALPPLVSRIDEFLERDGVSPDGKMLKLRNSQVRYAAIRRPRGDATRKG